MRNFKLKSLILLLNEQTLQNEKRGGFLYEVKVGLKQNLFEKKRIDPYS
jgi:hypothetical protein